MQCPKCVAEIPDDDVFCERCGTKIQVETEPASEEVDAECPCFTGLEELDEDGYCLRCGRRVLRPVEDHLEAELSADFGAVSDRGLHHHSNEDRFAIGVHSDFHLIAVCDGVSSSPEADKAAAQASQAALTVMQTDLANDATALDAVKHSVEAASAAVSALGLRRSEAPSSTIVCAVASGQQIAIAWIGDSRAYWITPAHAQQLTSDHSWLNMVLQNGELDRTEAQKSRQAHALTRWLGLDSDPGDPDTVVHSIDQEGIVLLCSDGLWNYAETDEAMRDVVQQSSQKSDTALELARRLVEYAIAQGGRDNITAVVMRRSAALDPENSL